MRTRTPSLPTGSPWPEDPKAGAGVCAEGALRASPAPGGARAPAPAPRPPPAGVGAEGGLLLPPERVGAGMVGRRRQRSPWERGEEGKLGRQDNRGGHVRQLRLGAVKAPPPLDRGREVPQTLCPGVMWSEVPQDTRETQGGTCIVGPREGEHYM